MKLNRMTIIFAPKNGIAFHGMEHFDADLKNEGAVDREEAVNGEGMGEAFSD